MSLFLRIGYRISYPLGRIMKVTGILLKQRGYYQSVMQETPVDSDGSPLPWITYPAMDYLSRLDFSSAAVLEYGSGASSLWWAARAARVTSVEGRAEWADRIRKQAPTNLEVLGPLEGEDYVRKPLEGGKKYHVIVIDGIHRHECARAALPHLAEGGFLIFDNADWHERTCLWLREQGLMQIDFHGFGPFNDYTWCTAIFIRAESAFSHSQQPWPTGIYGSLPPPLSGLAYSGTAVLSTLPHPVQTSIPYENQKSTS